MMKGLEPTLIKYNLEGEVIQKVNLPEVLDSVEWLYADEKGDYFAALLKTDILQIICLRANGMERIVVPIEKADAYKYSSVLKLTSLIAHHPSGGYWLLDPKQGALLSEKGEPLWTIPNNSGHFIQFTRQNYFEDGMIWQCGSNGLTSIKFTKKHFKVLFDKEEKSFRQIMRVNHHLFFSTEGAIYQQRNGITAKFLEKSSLSSIKESDTTAWFGRFKELWSLNVNTKKIEDYPVYQNEIWSLWLDTEQKLWFSEIGLHCFNTSTKQLEAVSYQGFEEILKSTVYYFHPISEQTAWLCTTTGLYELDTHNKKNSKTLLVRRKGGILLACGRPSAFVSR
ncbi:MAG: hypothetical protein HC892_21505 [Saprospiraceae bacterium]|nr:hypothetical protein [Saprospiraceae bacterium]